MKKRAVIAVLSILIVSAVVAFPTRKPKRDESIHLRADAGYTKLRANALTVYTVQRQTFMAGASFGTNLGTSIPVYDTFALGGLLNLGGYASGQLRGQHFALARLGTYTLTLVAGADTVVGPIFVAYARANAANGRFYVTIGKTF